MTNQLLLGTVVSSVSGLNEGTSKLRLRLIRTLVGPDSVGVFERTLQIGSYGL